MTTPSLIAVALWVALAVVISGWGLAFAAAAKDASTSRSRLRPSATVVRDALWPGLVGVTVATMIASLVEGGSSLVRPALILALVGVAGAGHYLGRSAWLRVWQRAAIHGWLGALVVILVLLVLFGLAALTAEATGDASSTAFADAPFGHWLTTLAPLAAMLGSGLGAPASLGLVALLAMMDACLRLLSNRPEVARGAGTWVLVVGLPFVLGACALAVSSAGMPGLAGASAGVLGLVSLAYVIDYWTKPSASAADAGSAGLAAAVAVVLAPWGVVLLLAVVVAVSVRIARRPPSRKRPPFGAMFGKALGPSILWAVVLAVLEAIRTLAL